jgi:quercetin dioxygenase-like cupin family protein
MLDILRSIGVFVTIQLSLLAPACTGSRAVAQGPSAAPAISRTLLEHHDLPQMPGWESRLYLIEYGPGVAAPVHHHPVEGVGYVVSGRFESAFEGEQPIFVSEGHSFTDRPLTSHTLFRNADSSRGLKFVINYVVRKGDPVVETP